MAQVIEPIAADWTPERVRDMIASDDMPVSLLDTMLAAIKKHPSLAVLSDDDFIGGVEKIKPEIAAIFRTPSGLDWMHKLSDRLVGHGLTRLLGFGGG